MLILYLGNYVATLALAEDESLGRVPLQGREGWLACRLAQSRQDLDCYPPRTFFSIKDNIYFVFNVKYRNKKALG